MIVEKVQCDHCGRLQGAKNGWFTILNRTWGEAESIAVIRGVVVDETARHLCGQECCRLEFQDWMSKVSPVTPDA